MQDPISDAITRIRNAQRAFHAFTEILTSKVNISILNVLQQEGYIEAYKVMDRKIKIALKYYKNLPVISKVKRISKPSRRVYKNAKQIGLVCNGLGIAVVSTSKGVVTDKTARELNLGGEVMLTVE